jgi:hypothetical protein
MVRISVFLAIIQQFCGITAIYFYSTSIFMQLGGGLFMARIVTVIMGIVNLFSSVGSLFLIPYFGRKTLLLSAEVLICIDMLILGICSGYATVDSLVLAVFLIAFFAPFGYGLASVFWMYLSEILNDQIFSFACIISFGLSIPVSLVFPIAVDGVGIGNCFLFFSVSMALGSLYTFFDTVETKGKEKEQILFEMKVLDASVVPDKNPEESDSLQEDAECEENEDNTIKNNDEKSDLDQTNISPEKLLEGKEVNCDDANNNSFSTALNYSTTNK